ncbi:thymidine kinase [Limosilactobacillus reuteri]|uniref:Thymidine kinase n=1 Tax=Limosilactobacillus reuteri TaxID=1598 RepID=A0ABD6Y6D0_LIMRT|nr:thymidine kinase [Limosilactobacillus reuteri]PWT37225.1 thymidine kinase [Limosilactobacillus reuteri]
MAQLQFKYGTMAAGKTLELLKVADSYKQTNKDVLILTSALDTRSGMNKVKSRVGLEAKAVSINKKDNIVKVIISNLIINTVGQTVWPACILIDEAEFLSRQQVLDLATLVDTYNIPILCFGLKTDYQGQLFDGSKALLELADKIEEIKSVCYWCDHKATMNLRRLAGKPIYKGDQILIGDEEYISVCRYHYLNPILS